MLEIVFFSKKKHDFSFFFVIRSIIYIFAPNVGHINDNHKMKHARLFVGVFLSVMLTASCSESKIVPVEQLPVAAKTYVEKAFPGRDILYVKEDPGLFSTKYEVKLMDGTEIEFDKNGEPLDIDMND